MNIDVRHWSIWFIVCSVYLQQSPAFGTRISKFQSDIHIPINCLLANSKCHSDVTCRIQLDYLLNKCHKDVPFCKGQTDKKTASDCADLLLGLQENKYFYKCSCDYNPRSPQSDNVRCLEVQSKIHDHPCSVTGGAMKGKNTRINEYYYYRDETTDYIDEDYGDFDDHEDLDDEQGGCIRARKLCLDDELCNKALTNYRIKCMERKRQNMCIAIDREGCFSAITTLKDLSPAIFTCQCNNKNNKSLMKCRRIRSRLANNTCLVEVPYFIHSRQPHEITYEKLVSIVEEPTEIDISYNEDNDEKSTCQMAFKECDMNPDCKTYMSKFIKSCGWSRKTYDCDKHGCLQNIKDFFVYIPQRRAQALLFCQCKKSDEKCKTLQRALYPTCSLVENPAPSCLNIMDRCMNDADCSQRYTAYEKNCGFARGVTLCPEGPAMCRNAMIGIMGTILTTNCTCLLPEHSENKKCMEVRWKLQGHSSCKKDAIQHFHLGTDDTETTFPQHDSQSVRTKGQQQYLKFTSTGTKTLSPPTILVVNKNINPGEKSYFDCTVALKSMFVELSYYETPDTIRIFQNDSDCSELCSCLTNGTLKCKKLPCMANSFCTKGELRAHGSTFNRELRGQCRCIKGEEVCPLPPPNMYHRPPGLFLHLGYSVSDKNLIEENSRVRFSSKNVTRKLSTILKGDSAEQVCTLSLHHAYRSNIVLMINTSKYNTKKDSMVGCVSAAKQLSNMINSRHPVIVKDAELSIIKVAQLENISIHSQENQPNRQSFLQENVKYESLDPTNKEILLNSNNILDKDNNINNNNVNKDYERDPTISSYKTKNKCSNLKPNKYTVLMTTSFLYVLVTLSSWNCLDFMHLLINFNCWFVL